MAVDIFLKIKEIKGESGDSEYGGAIQVKKWRWGIVGGRYGSGNPTEVRDVTIVKDIDRSSPILWSYCCSRKEIKEAELCFRKAGKTPLTYLTFTLSKVLIASVDMEVGAEGEIPSEVAVLNFHEVIADYQAQKETGGKEGGVVSFSFITDQHRN